jgi:hypothetical protein
VLCSWVSVSFLWAFEIFDFSYVFVFWASPICDCCCFCFLGGEIGMQGLCYVSQLGNKKFSHEFSGLKFLFFFFVFIFASSCSSFFMWLLGMLSYQYGWLV